MIAYDLKCKNGHEFETWFRDSAAYETLRKARSVTCPDCGSAAVKKALMVPNVAAGKDREASPKLAEAKRAHQFFTKFRDFVEKNADDVGDSFAEEARKIHYGEAEGRNIYGNATNEESVELHDEGIEVRKIPWPNRHS